MTPPKKKKQKQIKAALAAKIAELVEARQLEGIADVRDESDRDGVRLVVEVKRGASARVVANNLFKHTRLQQRFSCNMVCLVGLCLLCVLCLCVFLWQKRSQNARTPLPALSLNTRTHTPTTPAHKTQTTKKTKRSHSSTARL